MGGFNTYCLTLVLLPLTLILAFLTLLAHMTSSFSHPFVVTLSKSVVLLSSNLGGPSANTFFNGLLQVPSCENKLTLLINPNKILLLAPTSFFS